MWWAVDQLASEYGWAKNDILDDTYLDELHPLLKQINKRRANEYKMQLAIAQNPHVKNPNELWKILEEQNREAPSLEFDDVGFENLKSRLQQSTKIKVK